jgi:hypothetical protein
LGLHNSLRSRTDEIKPLQADTTQQPEIEQDAVAIS